MGELQVKIDGEWKFLEKIEEVEINDEMLGKWKKGELFVCPDQPEELEVELTNIENTEVAKSIEEAFGKRKQDKCWWEGTKQ